MSVAAKLSSIAGISLKPVVNGAISGPNVLSETLWDIKEPLIIFVARRPGCILCREIAVDLNKRLKAGDFQNAKLVGIIKEVAPVSGAATDEELGVAEFQNEFFEGHPVYVDEKKSFYEALGNQSLLAQKWHTWNPFQLYRDYKTMKQRLNDKKVAGNLKGEGFLKGGIFIVSKDKDVLYSYPETTGSVFDYDDISKRVASINEGIVLPPKPTTTTTTTTTDGNTTSLESSVNQLNLSPEILSEKRFCAQATLFTVLENFLRLCHPLMPFVTEELWQRLPGLSSFTTIPSIMISPYPIEIPTYFHPDMESQMEIIKETIHAARSLRADYRIANHIKGEFFYKSDSQEVLSAYSAQGDDFNTLAKATSFKYISSAEDTPKGCGIKVLSTINATLYLNLSDIVNIEQEIIRLFKEVDRLTPLIEQYKRKMNASGYEDKVPADVRATNSEKLSAYETEMITTLDAIKIFQAMK